MAGRLQALDLPAVAAYIQSEACRRICVLTGAGVSTGAGIPDFRSPGGMYSELRPELITATDGQRQRMRADPTEVVDKTMFFENQFPYLEVRRPFILGTQQQQWQPTISHWFVKFLADEGKLTRLFTQNIDGLDYHTGIDGGLVCNVHGSLGKISCEACGADMPMDDFCTEVRRNIKDIYGQDKAAPSDSSNVRCKSCGKPTVKPSTVLFGGSLPADFFQHRDAECPQADLLIIAGTSLVVSPANSVVSSVADACPRLVVNREQVGRALGVRYGQQASRDVWGGERDCDEVFLELIKLLGWEDKLAAVQERLPEKNQQLLQQG